ncbi:MAG: cysteine dioxygenase [Rhizobiaceae bacterium]|nr:cysteine dioxygenase [Rhizobiaceae bacterium]
MPARSSTSRLGGFIAAMSELADRAGRDESVMIGEGRRLLADLVSQDDWLPDEFARPHPQFYSQYLLYCDPFERFSIVSFVWGPGQTTPIHNHTVWGLIGMLRGAETSLRYEAGSPMIETGLDRLEPGDVDVVSPNVGDIHKVSNALADQTSISIHVYGANIGAVSRAVFDPLTGAGKDFVSGYSNSRLPNPWRGVNV